MTENDPLPKFPVDSPPPPPMSRKAKLGLGAALVVLPLGAAWAYTQLKDATNRQNRAEEDGATYRISALTKVDPALLKYHQVAPIITGMQAPRAMTVDAQGRVLVAGDRIIRILGPKGETVSDIALSEAPFCLAGSADGSIFVGFKEHIEVYAADGHRQAVWNSFGPNALLTGLAVHGPDVYAADAGRRLVVRCNRAGQVLGELGKNDGSPDVGLILPSPYLNVAGLPDGQVLVANPGRHRVEVYSPDGQLQSFFGTAGTAIANFVGCCNPSHLALLADGRIVTAEKGLGRVKVYLPDGRLDAVVAGPETFGNPNRGMELAVDAANRVLVLEPGTSNIRVFAPNDMKEAGAL